VPQAAATRLASLKRLAEEADGLADLTPEQGAAVARYLLVPKAREEYDEMRYQVSRVGRWNAVRLGLADELAGTRLGTSALQQERILEVVSEVLGREVALAENEAWRRTQESLSRTLLREVYHSLASADGPAQEGEPSAEMQELYAMQARLLGVPPDDYAGAATPAAVLELMIAHYAKRLDQARLRADDKKRLDRLPHDLAVAEYLGENDLARTVLLQRIWARLLAAGAIAQNPGRTAVVEQILRKLDESDRDAQDVLLQLRDGERTLVELWMALSGVVPVETAPK
jgi:hypothetical protein